MGAVYRINPTRVAAIDRIVDRGLKAGARIVQADVRRRYKEHHQGYLHGEFAHAAGGVASTVTIGEPHTHEGNRRILIGTNKRSPEGYSYPLAWELGFVPARGVFSPGVGGKHAGPIAMRRVEIWRPALVENIEKIRAAFSRTTDRFLGPQRV